ncbi:MAG: hypothetical protein ACFFFG_05495 [Candidatus Thorarchaeota archaeon]
MRNASSWKNIWLILIGSSFFLILLFPIWISAGTGYAEVYYDGPIVPYPYNLTSTTFTTYTWTTNVHLAAAPEIYEISLTLPFEFSSQNSEEANGGKGSFVVAVTYFVNGKRLFQTLDSNGTISTYDHGFYHAAIGAGFRGIFSNEYLSQRPNYDSFRLGWNEIMVKADFWTEIIESGQGASLLTIGPFLVLKRPNRSVDGIAEEAKIPFFRGIQAYFLQSLVIIVSLPLALVLHKSIERITNKTHNESE